MRHMIWIAINMVHERALRINDIYPFAIDKYRAFVHAEVQTSSSVFLFILSSHDVGLFLFRLSIHARQPEGRRAVPAVVTHVPLHPCRWLARYQNHTTYSISGRSGIRSKRLAKKSVIHGNRHSRIHGFSLQSQIKTPSYIWRTLYELLS